MRVFERRRNEGPRRLYKSCIDIYSIAMDDYSFVFRSSPFSRRKLSQLVKDRKFVREVYRTTYVREPERGREMTNEKSPRNLPTKSRGTGN